MAGELLRPGVEVIQTFRSASPSFVRPTLVPCVVGPAFEVINVLNTDGTINSKAEYGAYSQIGSVIAQSSFPDPRANNDELDFLEETIRPFMVAGGNISEMLMDPGEAFLTTSHGASKAAIKTGEFGGAVGLALAGKVLVLAIDQTVAADRSADVTVTFTGTGNLTAQQCADQINDAVGMTVATVVGSSPNDRVQIASPTYGATSSVTIRKGASANTVLHLGIKTSDSSAIEERVEGSGYRGQDDNDNDTKTPWIEFYAGDYFQDSVATAFDAQAGLINVETGSFTSAKAASVTFGAGNTVPVEVGDYFYADGLRLESGEIMKVESTRFKVGTINTALSVADEDGNYISKVYDAKEVATLFDGSPFAPKYAYFRATNIDWEDVAPVAASIEGGLTGTAAASGIITGDTLTDATAFPMALAGLKLDWVVEIDGVETEGQFTFTGGPYVDMAAVVAAIDSNITGVIPTATVPGVGTSALRLTTSKTGRLQSVTIKASGTANAALGWSTSSATSGSGSDVEFAGLTAKKLAFTFDKNPHQYLVTFTSDSLDLACEEINELVGATVASISGGSSNKIKLTSTLKGSASAVTIDETTSDADTVLGLDAASTPTAVAGSGRPLPDAYLDDVGSLHIQSQIIRDQMTGYPLDFATNSAKMYIQFKALRKDVSAVAQVAGVLRIPDQETLASVLDPLTEDNPLGLALFLTMINAPTFEVKGLGIDEVTAAAPEGTAAAYARAAALLEAEEVYAIAPLTQDEVITGLWRTHATAMSEAEQGGERIVFFNHASPTRKNPTIAASGTSANSTSTSNQLLLDMNPAAGLIAAGINPALPIDADMGVYAEFELNGEVKRYNVSSVSGSLVNFRVSFADGENDDGFYATSTFDDELLNASYSLNVRGESLVIPGSNPERLDYSLVAETVAAANESFKNRRAFSVYPDVIKTTVAGVEKSLPGYYACAAIAGMVASQSPQQGFTNLPITGITGVVGPEKFSKKQLNVMAGGGTYILMQEVPGGAVFCRHQLSTDLTSIETRELSITKVVDFVAKFMRGAVRKFIGVNVINTALLDSIGTTINGVLDFLVNAGVLNGANLNNIAQDSTQPDTVLIDITLDVPYPCNYIRLVLVV